jgi:hypothetical protein
MSDPETFDGLDEFYNLVETAPEIYEGEIVGHRETADGEEWDQYQFRRSLWIEDGGMVGDVSANEDYYRVIQYEDALDAVGAAFSTHDVEPKGYLQYSDSGHLLIGYADIPDAAVTVADGDVIDLGVKFRIGQTGFHGLSYDVGAVREVCSNGMTAFVSDMQMSQTHKEPLNYGLPRQAVAGIIDGVDGVERRLQDARERTFVNRDEALLTLLDIGIDQYFDTPVAVLEESLDAETGEDEAVSLYNAYNAATRALTHHADLDMTRRDYALERAASLVDRNGMLPDVADLGMDAVERRVGSYADDGDETEPYWDGERETLSELVELRGDGR